MRCSAAPLGSWTVRIIWPRLLQPTGGFRRRSLSLGVRPFHIMRESDIDKIAEIHRQMRVVLARDWDPIGVGDAPGAFDEYFGYVRGAYDVAIETRSAEAVARYLIEIECDRMGLHRRPV